MVSMGATGSGLSGAVFGSLIGLLFLNPLFRTLVGDAFGAGAGALAGRADRLRDQRRSHCANSPPSWPRAAPPLFLLVRKAQPEKVLAEFKNEGGEIIRSSLSPEQEQRLRQAISAAAA